jgi:hypothetical protein
MNDIPRCVVCDKPTLLTLSTWFAAGPVVIGFEPVKSGVAVPACNDCHRELGPSEDSIHVML